MNWVSTACTNWRERSTASLNGVVVVGCRNCRIVHLALGCGLGVPSRNSTFGQLRRTESACLGGIPPSRSLYLQLPESPNINPPGPVLGPLCIDLVVWFLLDGLLTNLPTLELATRNGDLSSARTLPPNNMCPWFRQSKRLALFFSQRFLRRRTWGG